MNDREHTSLSDRELESLLEFDGAKALEQIRKRQKRLERVTIGLAVVFVLSIVSAVMFSEVEVMKGTARMLRVIGRSAGGSRDIATNCQDERNKNTKYCIERAAAIESNWRSVVRFQGGKSNAFTLHEPGSKSNR